MDAVNDRKRKRPNGQSKKPIPQSKKQRRAAAYHSSSESDDDHTITLAPQVSVDQADSPADDKYKPVEAIAGPTLITSEDIQPTQNDHVKLNGKADSPEDDEDDEADENRDADSEAGDESSDEDEVSTIGTSSTTDRKLRKRNDPDAFATSISRILDSKLTTSKRADPVLSRSKDASVATKELAESKLEAKAKRKLRDDKKAAMDRGHVTDVLGLGSAGGRAGEIAEVERRLKKTAQRGVVKLFNAVKAAQVKAEEAEREARGLTSSGTGLVGADRRQERVTEMSKKGFLDLLVGDGKT